MLTSIDVSNEKVTVMLSVKDQGPGISIEDQGKFFKNFVQIRPGKLQKGGGSGLGLTIAKQIVELHGGRIGVISEEGQGSQFYFAIPFQVTTRQDFKRFLDLNNMTCFLFFYSG